MLSSNLKEFNTLCYLQKSLFLPFTKYFLCMIPFINTNVFYVCFCLAFDDFECIIIILKYLNLFILEFNTSMHTEKSHTDMAAYLRKLGMSYNYWHA